MTYVAPIGGHSKPWFDASLSAMPSSASRERNSRKRAIGADGRGRSVGSALRDVAAQQWQDGLLLRVVQIKRHVAPIGPA